MVRTNNPLFILLMIWLTFIFFRFPTVRHALRAFPLPCPPCQRRHSLKHHEEDQVGRFQAGLGPQLEVRESGGQTACQRTPHGRPEEEIESRSPVQFILDQTGGAEGQQQQQQQWSFQQHQQRRYPDDSNCVERASHRLASRPHADVQRLPPRHPGRRAPHTQGGSRQQQPLEAVQQQQQQQRQQ